MEDYLTVKNRMSINDNNLVEEENRMEFNDDNLIEERCVLDGRRLTPMKERSGSKAHNEGRDLQASSSGPNDQASDPLDPGAACINGGIVVRENSLSMVPINDMNLETGPFGPIKKF